MVWNFFIKGGFAEEDSSLKDSIKICNQLSNNKLNVVGLGLAINFLLG